MHAGYGRVNRFAERGQAVTSKALFRGLPHARYQLVFLEENQDPEHMAKAHFGVSAQLSAQRGCSQTLRGFPMHSVEGLEQLPAMRCPAHSGHERPINVR